MGSDEAPGVDVGDVLFIGVAEGSVVGEGEFVGFTEAEDVGAGVGFGVGDEGVVGVGLVVGGVVGGAVGLGVVVVPAVIMIEGFSEYVSAKIMFSWVLRAEAAITNWSVPPEMPVT